MANDDVVGEADQIVVKDEVISELADLHLSTSTPESSLRRSSRKRTAVSFKDESSDEELPGIATPKRNIRRKLNVNTEIEDAVPTPVSTPKRKQGRRTAPAATSPQRLKREYAPPETYAHLDPLNDLLQEHLDVMFCGINPGQKSAEVGFHFAHSTNHFWRAIHLAGFTDRLLKPAEEALLPKTYNVGLTDLVERPSAEQAELSLEDMHAGVPVLLAKIVRYQPRVVCFVGKQIGETFLSRAPSAAPPPADGATPAAGTDKTKGKKPKKPKFEVGFAPYKVLHAPGAAVPETLFYIMPSTSARVTGYQLADKTKILRELYDEVQRMKAGEGMDTSGMRVITPPGPGSER